MSLHIFQVISFLMEFLIIEFINDMGLDKMHATSAEFQPTAQNTVALELQTKKLFVSNQPLFTPTMYQRNFVVSCIVHDVCLCKSKMLL